MHHLTNVHIAYLDSVGCSRNACYQTIAQRHKMFRKWFAVFISTGMLEVLESPKRLLERGLR